MAGARFDDRREVVAFVAPHGAHHGDLVDDPANVRKPVRYGSAGFAMPGEGAVTRNYRALHGGQVVSETHGIDQFAGMRIALRVKGVDVADSAGHEQEDDRSGFGSEVGPHNGIGDLAGLGPQAAECDAEKSAPGTEQKLPPVEGGGIVRNPYRRVRGHG